VSNNPFDFLLDQFNKKALRPLLESTKQKLDDAIDSTPTSLFTRQLEDAFEQLKTGLNGPQIDPALVTPFVDKLKAQLQNPALSLIAAQGLKEVAKKNTGSQSLLGVLSALVDVNASTTDVARQLRTIAASLPSEVLAEQIVAALQQAAPKAPAPDLSQFPAPDAIADATLDVLKAASKALGDAANGASLKDTLNALKQFPANANEIVERLRPGTQDKPQQQPPAAEDKPVKKQPRRRRGPGGGFDL
jgi:hypothetical protein